MKDKQIASPSAEPSIFLVSPALHCVSMIAFVFLRSSFGFAFLRPKSFFLALSWAFVLYAIYAWIDGEVWREQRSVLLFFGGATALYWCHLFAAFSREWRQRGEHDHYSGKSHSVWLLQKVGGTLGNAHEATVHLWIEPAIVALAAGGFWLILKRPTLSRWLLAIAVCLWCKEALNHWFGVRQWKRQQDMFSDTEGAVEPLPTRDPNSEQINPVRKIRVRRPRESNGKQVL